MASLSIRNARAIVTVDDADRVLTNGNLLIEDGVITYVGAEEQPADRVLDAQGCFVYPGLVNTHHHLYQTFTRNLPQVQKMELFPWLVTLYEIWRGLDAEWGSCCVTAVPPVWTITMYSPKPAPRALLTGSSRRRRNWASGSTPHGAACPVVNPMAVCRRTIWCSRWT